MWKYQELLNADLAILLVIATGWLAVLGGALAVSETGTLNRLLFKFLLPASVVFGLGLKTDLLDGDIWRFVGAFLVLRAVVLALCAALYGAALRRSLGEVTSQWLVTSWISTVVLGTPILKALLGPQYASLGVVAGISSFIFQLPVMLLLFEVDAWRRENLGGGGPPAAPLPPPDAEAEAAEGGGGATPPGEDGKLAGTRQQQEEKEQRQHKGGRGCGLLSGVRASRRQLRGLGHRLLLNHVLWAVLIGAILSFSTIGWKWLNPGSPPAAPNCTYVAPTGFIWQYLDYLSRCTETVAFLAIGLWMWRRNPLACGAWKALAYMAFKLVGVPALMVGVAKAVKLEGAYGRAAVVVAALPVSPAAFALSGTYRTHAAGEAEAAANVFLGNLLVLPTTLAWVAFLDAVNLFVPGAVAAAAGAAGGNPCAPLAAPPAPLTAG